MKDEEFIVWKARVPQLSPEQVQILYHALSSLGNQEQQIEDQTTTEGDWLYSGIVSAFKDRHLLSTSSQSMLLRTKGYRKYLNCAPDIRKKLVRILGSSSRTEHRYTLAYYAGTALINFCEAKGVPKQAGIILGFSCQIIEAIESQFPGYIEANMFGFVLDQMGVKRNGKH